MIPPLPTINNAVINALCKNSVYAVFKHFQEQLSLMSSNLDTAGVRDAMTLAGSVVRPREIDLIQRRAMYRLLQAFFENVTWPRFVADLDEKEWVFLFRDAANQIQGFSTLMRYSVESGESKIVAFYSGDTIIHPDYWQELELPKLWGRHVFALAGDEPAGTRVFWFLISSGYKTYRFLPVFFQTFYPSFRQPTPPEIQQILDAVARRKFPQEYDPRSGLIRLAESSPLRSGVADVTGQRMRNKDIAFFLQRNPRHAQGEQLACLVEIRRDNLTPAGQRMLGMAG